MGLTSYLSGTGYMIELASNSSDTGYMIELASNSSDTGYMIELASNSSDTGYMIELASNSSDTGYMIELASNSSDTGYITGLDSDSKKERNVLVLTAVSGCHPRQERIDEDRITQTSGYEEELFLWEKSQNLNSLKTQLKWETCE
ncbi:hypothetical protein HNY73_010347 [Argiope bruennichi]|uniref:Uncharacterized protein n=1 Tax=Argiope bruennichi TaxID=94029 RepID=A0A8T0F2L6_ARGBR|nr:hypothetical protein HNY73_010347 [Argiope bruennichi]